MAWRMFIVEDANLLRVGLRRYRVSTEKKCPGPYTYHDAEAFIGDMAAEPAGPFLQDPRSFWRSPGSSSIENFNG